MQQNSFAITLDERLYFKVALFPKSVSDSWYIVYTGSITQKLHIATRFHDHQVYNILKNYDYYERKVWNMKANKIYIIYKIKVHRK